MTQELIERVAEAIHIARYRQDQEPTPFSGEYADGQQYCRRLALAAIEACGVQSLSARIAELREALREAQGYVVMADGLAPNADIEAMLAKIASLTKDSTSG